MERRFVVYTEPHPQDPSWINPVLEVQQNPANGQWEVTKPHQDGTELAAVAKEIADRMSYAAAFNAGAAHVMKVFGHTPDAYYKTLKAQKGEKQNAVSAEQVPATPATVPSAESVAESGTVVGPTEGQ